MAAYGIEYNGVRFLPDRVELLTDGSPVASVKKEEVCRVSAHYMFQAERPMLQLVFGSLLMLPLAWPIYELMMALFFGGTFYFATLIMVLFPVSLGGYLVWHVPKRSHLLLVELEHSQRKFPFSQPVKLDVLLIFLHEASKLGYNVDMTSARALYVKKHSSSLFGMRNLA